MIRGAKYCPLPALARLGFKDNAEVVSMLKMGNITDNIKLAIHAGNVVCGARSSIQPQPHPLP